MRVKIYDDNNKEIKDIQAADNNFALICNGETEPEYHNSFRFLRLDDQHIINQAYRETANLIVTKYSTLLYSIYPHMMVFVVDEMWEPSEKSSTNSKWKIDIQRAPKWLRLCFGFEYMVKMRGHWLEKWSEAQLNAAIMSQLLRINPQDGSIVKYTEDMNSRMIATFGAGYLEPNTVIPDLLKENVKILGFKEASGQVTIEELESEVADDDKE